MYGSTIHLSSTSFDELAEQIEQIKRDRRTGRNRDVLATITTPVWDDRDHEYHVIVSVTVLK